MRKISAHEFERGGLLKPIVNTIDGTPTFLSPVTQCEANENAQASHSHVPYAQASSNARRSRHEFKHLDEKELIFELVSDFCKNMT